MSIAPIIIDDANQAMLDNYAFIEKLKRPDGVEKTASAMTDFVRSVIREEGFARKIFVAKPVAATDLIPQQNTDQPMRLVDLDRPSKAYPVTFAEAEQQKYYEGRRFPVYYTKYESEKFYKPVEEIMTYRIPIKTIVQENYLRDIEAAEDGAFVSAVDSIIAARESATKGDAMYEVSGPFTPAIMAEGWKKLVAKKVPRGTILINEQDFLDLLKLTHSTVGSAVMEDIVVNGYSYTTFMGHTFIRTLKHEVVAPGNIYLFSTPEYMGVFDILTDVKAYVEQKGSNVYFYLYETVGCAIGNVNGVAKIKLK